MDTTMDALNVTPIPGTNLQIIFSWYDYTLFSFMLILSAVIGIYFGCFGKKQSTAHEYLLGGKAMKMFPIAMSLVASKVSGVALLSVPADVYRFGSTYWFACLGMFISTSVTYFVYLPVFYKLQLTSTYEYLKLRFDTRTRVFASFVFALQVILHLPIVIYTPALALSQATNIDLHYITPVVCGVCIFYTTIGGLKAVVWTDMLQFCVTCGAMATVLYMGIVAAGGLPAVLSKASEGHRLDISFDIDPTNRDTFWAMMIGWTISSTAHLAISQASVQKYLALPTRKDVKKSLIVLLIGIILVKTTCVLTGLIMYSKYANCDPLTMNIIQKPDQLLPYYVMDVASRIPGLSGLFIAGVFCASLSTLSAAMNCLSGTIYEDFLSRHMPKDISQKTVSNILKLEVIIIGLISTGLVYIVEHLGGILAISTSLSGVTTGPVFGLFSLGMFFPRANAKGAFYGTITSLVFICWLMFQSQWYQAQGLVKYIPKPVSTAGCSSEYIPKMNSTIIDQPAEIFFLYKISFYYYTVISTVVAVVVGYIISIFTNKDDPPVHKDLLSPVVHFMLKDRPIDKEYYSVEKALHIVTENNLKNGVL